ncbi:MULTISPECIES: HNH endonuclease signature motif containing protein [Nostoc]|uniref:HNH endonuclease n=1 Tax=Nostoc paludosum FACHB-159 TaxID=2692908 RepID=A0ABR8KCZ3_9NOSO|nr:MULTISPECIES: HNH endonuclease signature motif containing protein [Nostoc]MBD2680922.1 HNH endonuclease [Nostoc sp. FACHB-857]MBD2737398.1 HNH endonuclease [Nostoc paludosum FACHB-159]MDZ8091568.1 HNH endonuclease signature motif containing protein [Nostoc sp. DedQUE05]
MPIVRQRYPSNWNEISFAVREAALWRCQHCDRLCFRPGEKPKTLTRSEWTMATLTVHHADFAPENNNFDNLIALCAPCHLALHARTKRSNVSPGQLSLW